MDDQPNLDLIRKVQQARAQHDADAQPSQAAGVYWIEAKPAITGAAPSLRAATPRAGHWLIRTTVREVDADWARIKAATESGALGYKSKVATAARLREAREHTSERVIHVMTYDASDAPDVARVGEALRALGYTDITYEPPT
jgi:hypothetical protein